MSIQASETADGAPAASTDHPQEPLSKAHTRGCPTSFAQLRALLAADLFRYSGKAGAKQFLTHFLFTPGFKYTVWMRSCGYLKINPWTRKSLYYVFKLMLMRCRYKYGIVIPEYTVVGPGLFINRFGGIYINGDAVIGRNVNITHGVMLGQANRGAKRGSPIIGDEVFLASGSKIVGRVAVGNRVAVGVNSVVTKDVPDGAVVGGVPAKILTMGGTDGYISHKAGPVDGYA